MRSVVFLILFSLFIEQGRGYLASFFGNSYIFSALNGPSYTSSSSILVRFQTNSNNGLLLLAAGEDDFIIVQLSNGIIQTNIGMQGEEITLSSSSNTKLNDLVYHEVKVIRSGNTFKMVVNGKDTIKDQIVSNENNINTLNVNYGVFIGGYGGNATLSYLNNIPRNFRGCLLHAEYNGVNLLNPLADIPGNKVVYNTQSGCPKELRASRYDSLSFESSDSFILFKRWTTQEEGTFECQIKTTKESGIILYNAGRGRNEFIGLEIVGGALRAAVNKGGGVVALHTTKKINDGQWHSVKFTFSPLYLEIYIDANRTKAFVEEANEKSRKQHRNLDLSGSLYIVGVEPKLSKTTQRQLISITNSDSGVFVGCIKNIRINFRRKGLEDAIASNNVEVGCKSLPKVSKTATFVDSKKADEKVSEIIAQKLKLKLAEPVLSVTVSPQLIYVAPIFDVILIPPIVNEGGSGILDKTNINLQQKILQFPKVVIDLFNISNLLVNVKRPPQHGFLVKGLDCSGFHVFEIPYNFLNIEKLSYCHDGSEDTVDFFQIQLTWNISQLSEWDRSLVLSQSGYDANERRTEIPLNNGSYYRIEIEINHTDDPPSLNIPSNYLFHPISNTKTILPSDVLQASDPDSPPSLIIYNILNEEAQNYFIEDISHPGEHISSFNQDDINEKRIYFVHTGGNVNARMVFRVSSISGNEISRSQQSAVMRIAAVPLKFSVDVQPDVPVIQGKSILITKNHLAIKSSVQNDFVIPEVNLIEPLKQGVLQINNGSMWENSTTFTTESIKQGKVRYLSTNLSNKILTNTVERLRFTVSGAGVTSEIFELKISIQKVLVEVDSQPLVIHNGNQETQLILNVNVHTITITAAKIQLEVLSDFTKSKIYYNDNGRKIHEFEKFTQSEINSGRVSVKAKSEFSASKFKDYAIIAAFVDGKYRSFEVNLTVEYLPDLKKIQMVNTGLVLDEGEEMLLSKEILSSFFIQSPNQPKVPNRFKYTLTKSPQHGNLIIGNNPNGNVTEFTSMDVANDLLSYRHDSSETLTDEFKFLVTPILDGLLEDVKSVYKDVFSEGTFQINIILVNDEKPERMVDRPFEIARRSERLLSKDDVWYHDKDVNFNDLDLLYIRRGIINGDIVNATSRKHEKLFEFTQRSIINNEVMFRHRGSDFGRFVFWVKDDKFSSTGLFVVKAGDPWIKVQNNTRLLVQKSKAGNLSSSNINVITNTKSLKSDIYYRISKLPAHGEVLFNGENMPLGKTFTQQDIDNMKVSYKHTGDVLNDIFLFEVWAGEALTSGNVTIKVFLESHQQPPTVGKNKLMTVDESGILVLKKQDIRVIHKDSRASDIIFTVTTKPLYGILKYKSKEEILTEFAQADINKGEVVYVQSGDIANAEYSEDGRIIDKIVVDVTNGIMTLKNVTIKFDIVPDQIPLHVGTIQVSEGRSKAVLSQYLNVPSPHFDSEITITVVSSPEYGMLESTRREGTPLDSFSMRLVDAEFLYYVHDGSDSVFDFVSLQASSADGKTSAIKNLSIEIIPENDEYPIVVNNTGIDTWVNSVTVITPMYLGATDADSSPKDLKYNILPPSNGWLALVKNTQEAILNFTQLAINKGEIVFVHKGAATGGFSFQVNDGDNFDVKQIFVVRARVLELTVDKNSALQVFPESATNFSLQTLLCSTNDKESRVVTYTIIEPPHFGQLQLLKSNATGAIKTNTFTQNDINKKRLQYFQNLEIDSWHELDRMEVMVSSPPAEPLQHVVIQFNITYDAFAQVNRHSPVKLNAGFNVTEGESKIISKYILDASNLIKKRPHKANPADYEVRYLIKTLPKHGYIVKQSKNITNFNHEDLQQNRISYVHDHSETTTDSFEIGVYLVQKIPGSEKDPPLITGSEFFDIVNIKIIPVNDNPPKLITKGRVLQVVKGFSKTIHPFDLEALDPDNPPNDIIFTIVRPPGFGHLEFIDINSTNILQFTQHDINNNRLIYIPDAEKDAQTGDHGRSDALYFSVTDGVHKPAYSLFQIKIVPVGLNCVPVPTSIEQGDFSLILTNKIINASTNGNHSLVTFTITHVSNVGTVLKKGQRVEKFTFFDLASGSVTYVMTDVEKSADVISFNISYHLHPELDVSTQLLISVSPLFSIPNHYEVSNAGLTRLQLNALQLQEKANSVPIFHVVEPPKHCWLMKVELSDVEEIEQYNGGENTQISLAPSNLYTNIPTTASPIQSGHRITKRDLSEVTLLKNTTSFSQSEINEGLVFIYVPFVGLGNHSTLGDNFTFRLTVEDNSVQPSIGGFNFNITNKPARDYTDFFNQFSEDEDYYTTFQPHEETIYKDVMMNTTAGTILETTFDQNHLELTTSIESVNFTTAKIEFTVKDVKALGSNILWVIPISIACSLVMIILMVIILVLYVQYKKKRKKTNEDKEIEKKTEKNYFENSDGGDIISDTRLLAGNGHVTVTTRRNTDGDYSYKSPTCPGVTVTPLLYSDYPDFVDSGAASLYNDSVVSSSMPYTSVLSGQTESDNQYHEKLINNKTQRYYYEDMGCVGDNKYGSRTFLELDPDVMALYSSEESIPSLLEFRSTYATGSVPTGLDRGGGKFMDKTASSGRSTASLPRAGINAELSLSPNSTIQNQYWV